MFKFRRGIIIEAEYKEMTEPYCHGMLQHLIIVDSENGEEFDINWISKNNEDLFGKGDKVSFLLQDGNIIRLKLNSFGV